MSAEPTDTKDPMDWFRSTSYRVAMLLMAAIVVLFWLTKGPRPGFALLLGCWTFTLAPLLFQPILRLLPPWWFRVRDGERVIHRVLGVEVFGELLQASGYNRTMLYPTWMAQGYKAGTRAGVQFRQIACRAGGGAHLACFAIHVLFAGLAFGVGQTRGAVWILVPGLLLHLYPFLLQRSIHLRLQPLLARAAAAAKD